MIYKWVYTANKEYVLADACNSTPYLGIHWLEPEIIISYIPSFENYIYRLYLSENFHIDAFYRIYYYPTDFNKSEGYKDFKLKEVKDFLNKQLENHITIANDKQSNFI